MARGWTVLARAVRPAPGHGHRLEFRLCDGMNLHDARSGPGNRMPRPNASNELAQAWLPAFASLSDRFAERLRRRGGQARILCPTGREALQRPCCRMRQRQVLHPAQDRFRNQRHIGGALLILESASEICMKLTPRSWSRLLGVWLLEHHRRAAWNGFKSREAFLFGRIDCAEICLLFCCVGSSGLRSPARALWQRRQSHHRSPSSPGDHVPGRHDPRTQAPVS